MARESATVACIAQEEWESFPGGKKGEGFGYALISGC